MPLIINYISVFIFMVVTLLSNNAIAKNEYQYVNSKLNCDYWYNIENGEYITMISTIYHHDSEGIKIDSSWYPDGSGGFQNGYNHFNAYLNDEEIKISSYNKKGDWTATPYLNDEKLDMLYEPIITNDVINKNYRNNVILLDYGVIKREIRVIPGHIYSTWIVSQKLTGELEIKINSTGNLTFIKGSAHDFNDQKINISTIGLNEKIKFTYIDEKIKYPIYLNDTLSEFYPDPGTGATTVDSEVGRYHAGGETFNVIRGSAGTLDGYDAYDNMNIKFLSAPAPNTDKYDEMWRGVITLDTSSIEDDATLVSAELIIKGRNKWDDTNNLPALGIYTVTPASDNTIVASDYNEFTTNVYTDEPVGYADFNIGTPGDDNIIEFNETGLSAINKMGITRLGLRESNYESPYIVPTWGDDDRTGFNIWSSDAGEGYEPVLMVTYYASPPDPPSNLTINQYSVDSITIDWEDDLHVDYTIIAISYNNETYYTTYNGTAETCNITGLDLNSTVYNINAYSVNQYGASTNVYDVIGGEDLAIDITIPAGVYALIASFGFLFLSFFIKSPLIYLAIIPCMIGILVEPAFKDMWLQAGAVLIMIWAGLAFYKKMQENSERG